MSDLITAKLQPYSLLSKDFQLFIAENSAPKQMEAGETVFEAGAPATHSFYLLKGKAKLITGKGKEISRGPSGIALSQGYDSYTLSCTTEEKSLILQINLSPKEQEKLLCWELASRFVSGAEWVVSLKDSGMFDQIPPGNLVRLVQGFTKKEVKAGDIVTRENKFENEFYVLLKGKAEVIQGKIDENSKAMSEISPFQAFGEASLMEDLPRTATIRMTEDGELAAFDTSNLDSISNENFSMSIFKDSAGLKEEVSNGTKILDIRPKKEAQLSPLKGAVLAPIDDFPESIGSISEEHAYIIYSPYRELNKLVYNLISEDNEKVSIYRAQ